MSQKVLLRITLISVQVVETIEEEMLKKYGFVWPVSVGFHAVESMAHVHLLVSSTCFAIFEVKHGRLP